MPADSSDDDRVRTGHEEDAVLDGGRWNEIAVQLTDMARALHDQDNPQDTLDEIVRSAVTLIPGARHAGIMMVLGRHEVRTVAQDDDVVGRVDQAQYDTSQGPCLDALYEHKTVSVPDLAAEDRWPAFTERARALGVASMLSFQLFVTERDLGALNLYSAEQHGFDDESEQVGLMFAAHAAVALSNAQQQQQLGRAVTPATSSARPRASSWNATRSPPNRRSRCWSAPASTPTSGFVSSPRNSCRPAS